MTNQDDQKQIPRIISIDDNPAIHDDFRKILKSNDSQKELDEAAAAFFGEPEEPAEHRLEVDLDFALQGEDGYQKVLAAVKSGRPYTLAFCDMRMPPGWDGLTTIENLWKADPKLQVVICSAYSDNTWTDISKRLGQSDRLLILKKPFDNVEVLQIAVSLIEKRRLIDAASIKQVELQQTVEDRTRHLKEARNESDQLLASIDAMMMGLDADGMIRRWNDRAVSAFGIATEEALGKQLKDLDIEWDDPTVIQSLIERSDSVTTKTIEANFVDPNAGNRVVEFSSYPVLDGEEYRGTLVLGMDLTERRTLELQLRNAQKLESVGQLAAGVAHELSTPMQYLGDNLDYLQTKFDELVAYLKDADELVAMASDEGYALTLVEGLQKKSKKLKLKKLYDQIPEALQDSVDGVRHVSRIVKAMKELSHPGGEDKSLVDLNHALETTITVSASEWKYVAELEKDFGNEVPSIRGFAGELNQVFLNLIVNASHAIAEKTDNGALGKGRIQLRTLALDQCVRVEIQDTGGGIPESIRDRIFDPFFTTKDAGKGTGQGLAIAHAVVVQKHNGRLWCDVEDGVGTTFIIELPILTEANESSKAAGNESTMDVEYC